MKRERRRSRPRGKQAASPPTEEADKVTTGVAIPPTAAEAGAAS